MILPRIISLYCNKLIIGIDHGYGNIKTANCCFPTGVYASDTEPVFRNDLLQWNGRYYTIGNGHKEFSADKMLDEDYYVLTLAAIARELNIAGMTDADVYLAAGLPLTWVSAQKDDFKKYLLKNETADFTFRGKTYHVRFAGADIYPQGFAVVADNLQDFSGINMLCDIGNGTMNIMYVNERKADPKRCYTEKYGTQQCMVQVRENLLRTHHAEPPEELITRVLRFGEADIAGAFLETIRETASDYVKEIFRKLREHGYDSRMMKLYIVGGGGCLIQNFGTYDDSRVFINDDICATAKGYERMMEMKMRRSGGKL